MSAPAGATRAGAGAGERPMSIRGMFRFADRVDVLLMALGTLGAIGDGCSTNLLLIFASDVMNALRYGGAKSAQFMHQVEKELWIKETHSIKMVGMEGAVVSGMLGILAKKLAPLVIKKYSSIVGVAKDLLDLQGLVVEINCWLEKAVYKTIGSGQLSNWLRQLKDVSYEVDDIVEEFHLEAEKHEADGAKHIVSKYLSRKPKSFLFQCKAASKIKAVKERFASIVKQRTDFSAIVNSLPDSHHVSHLNRTARAIPLLAAVDEPSVRGRDQEKQEIISKLVDNNNQQIIKIVSIFGLGGCGKTTLAKLVFNDSNIIKSHFDVRIWVHVSQEFDVEKLVQKLFEAISCEKHESISDKLTGKSYLLVLDDVWTEDRIEWEEFIVHIKSGAPGSSILLTTRNRKVAEAVDSTDTLNLLFLSEVDSWAVFSQSFGMPLKGLDSEFLEVGREIVNKCGGVPLAIKVLAGVLRDKRRLEEWKAVRDNNLLDVKDKENRVFACLKLSYFHLPSHLKQCFAMCSLFPKGHEIYKEQLIAQWIAHNIINLTIGVDYLEDIGDKHFNSLVQVCFLQDVDEYDGKVTCRMHDLVHDLARSILCEEISTIVPEDATSSAKGYRYFSLIEQPRKKLPKRVFDNACAIYVDKSNDIRFGKSLRNAKYLRSIIVNPILSTAVLTAIFQLPKSFGKLKRLRTLNLAWCSKLKSLPASIGDCSMLSTLDLEGCPAFGELPNSIDRNKRLRVLRLVLIGICRLPSSITTLENLEYLKLKQCYKLAELPRDIGNLKKLRALDLDGYEAMPPGIGQLTRLEKLNSFSVQFDKKYARISELATLSRISGKLSIYFLRCLTDPCDARRACLKQKENLHELELSWGSLDEVNAENEVDVLDGLEPPIGIKRLKIRTFGGGRFAWWMLKQVGRGVQGLCQFPFLTKLSLHKFPNLKNLDGLVQLPCLEKLHLKNMPPFESISGGPSPSLEKLKLKSMHSLGEVWMVTDRTLFGREEGEGCSNHNPHQSGQVHVGSRLANLDIEHCPKLVVRPCFPTSLERLKLDDSNGKLLLSPCQGQGFSLSSNCSPFFNHLKVLTLRHMKSSLSLSPPPPHGLRSGCRFELLQHISALKSLRIFSCSDLTELPECLGQLHFLEKMTIKDCSSLSNLPQSIGHLTSLRDLKIEGCDALLQFPEGLGELCYLRKFQILHLRGLTCLPQSLCGLMSLQELHIGGCDALGELPECLCELHCLRKLNISSWHGIKSLPRWIKGLSALQRSEIHGCPNLEWRCERGIGEDWHLISHIPHLEIGDQYD